MAEQGPWVSVIVPTHNQGRFLGEALGSILGQSFRDFELLVVDDGSTDETAAILEAERDPRLRRFRTDRVGVSAARNLALDRARGHYVAFLDGDDRWLPHKLETDHHILSRNPEVDVLFGNFHRFYSDTGGIIADQHRFMPERHDLPSRGAEGGMGRIVQGRSFAGIVRFREFPFMLQSMAFRREAVSSVRFRDVTRDPRGRLTFDELSDFGLRVLAAGATLAFHEELVAEVRRHSENMSSDVSSVTLARLRALEGLRAESLTAEERSALRDRTALERLAAAQYLLTGGRAPGAAFRELVLAAGQGRSISAMKLMVKAPVLYLTSSSS